MHKLLSVVFAYVFILLPNTDNESVNISDTRRRPNTIPAIPSPNNANVSGSGICEALATDTDPSANVTSAKLPGGAGKASGKP